MANYARKTPRLEKSDHLIAMVTQETAQLRKEAEDERMARIQIEENVEWRRLTKKQSCELKSKLGKFAGQVANTDSYQLNPEAAAFANDIVLALRAAKWKATLPSSPVVLETPMSGSPYTLKRGVTVMGSLDKVSREASKALVRILNEFGFDAEDGGMENTRSPLVSIEVHLRPEGPQGEAKLRAEARKNKPIARRPTAPLPAAPGAVLREFVDFRLRHPWLRGDHTWGVIASSRLGHRAISRRVVIAAAGTAKFKFCPDSSIAVETPMTSP